MKAFALLTILSAAVLLSGVIADGVKRYDGYKVFTVTTKDRHGFEALKKLQETSLIFDFWTEPSMHRPTDIMAPPTHISKLVQLLDDIQASYEVKIEDVQSSIDKTKPAPVIPHHARSSGSARYTHNWTSYSRYQTINDFVNELATLYPSLVTVTSIGKSVEGRDILMMKVSTGSTSTKKALFIDGGIHAREWISPATVTWMMSELVERNADHPELTRDLDWYFVPVINPDGYEYTHTTDRLWRKNRNTTPQGNCLGVDLNRNGCFHWAEGGTSPLGCSDLYHGTSCNSEPETQNLGRAIQAAAGNRTKVYLTFHSYGQDMLTPWSYEASPLPDNYNDMLSLATRATRALTTVYGTPYGVGNSYQLYGATAGSTDDWSKGTFGIPYAYTVELRDEGQQGFVLNETQIIPTATETWELVKVVANEIISVIPL